MPRAVRAILRVSFAVTFVALALSACGDEPTAAGSAAARARELARAGRADEAIAAWRTALAARDDGATRLELARGLAGLGRVEEASKEYATLLERSPRDAGLWLEFGRLAREQRRDPRGAELAFRKAVELLPDSAEAHGSLGLALFDLGDHEGASAELQAALSLAPSDAPWRAEVERVLVLAHLRQRAR
jgi:tetratricopeptide (TPR) repeat protein